MVLSLEKAWQTSTIQPLTGYKTHLTLASQYYQKHCLMKETENRIKKNKNPQVGLVRAMVLCLLTKTKYHQLFALILATVEQNIEDIEEKRKSL